MLELLISPIAALLDKVIPDADERNRLANEIATLAERQAHEIAKAQIEVNKAEAQSKSLFVSGWRPFIAWVCGVSMASNFLIAPYITAFTVVVIPTLAMSVMMPVLMGMLGLGAMRSYEKTKGVARSS